MSTTPWIKFYASDWLAGTSGLTAAERGVYITILALIYENGGAIRLDRSRLARRCGVPAGSFKRILEGLIAEGKLVEVDGGLTNRRAETELGERENLRTKHQSGAQKTNTIRAKKNQQKQCPDERPASRTADAYQKPETREKEEPNGSSKKRGSRLPPDWQLPKAWGEWAVAEGMDEVSVRREADKFRDYWVGVPGAKGVKLDWQATWRNWVRKAVSDRASPRQRRGEPEPGEVRIIQGKRKVYDPFNGWLVQHA